MATLAEHIAARKDDDLLDRLVAAAERAGVPSPRVWVEQRLGELVAVDVGETSLATLYAYAVATYEPTPRPGEDATKITDEHVRLAVEGVKTAAPLE